MSQVLSLIVAASVLMMTALTVIIMTTGGLGDLGDTSNRQSCMGAIESTCQVSTSGQEHSTPTSCDRADVTSGDVGHLVQRYDTDTFVCD